MPPEKPAPELTASESNGLHDALVALRDELASALAGSRDAAKPVDLDEPIGRLSRMDAIQQQQMARASRGSLALRAKQVTAALERVVAGTYGACLSCEESVGYARLQARPETPFCITCQIRREQR
jgi:DnaK suppressor protein